MVLYHNRVGVEVPLRLEVAERVSVMHFLGDPSLRLLMKLTQVSSQFIINVHLICLPTLLLGLI